MRELSVSILLILFVFFELFNISLKFVRKQLFFELIFSNSMF